MSKGLAGVVTVQQEGQWARTMPAGSARECGRGTALLRVWAGPPTSPQQTPRCGFSGVRTGGLQAGEGF